MIDELILQLGDSDPARRRQAIIALGKTKNMAALRPLARVFRSDSDLELRELARKAGVYIRQQNELLNVPSPEESDMYATLRGLERSASYTQRRLRQLEEEKQAQVEAAPPVVDPAASRRPIRGREYRVPDDAKERAKKYVDSALTDNARGNDAAAMKSLTQAISLNPNLVNDAYFNSVASAVTQLDGDAALDLIIDKGQRKQFEAAAKGATKQAKIDKHMEVADKTSWTDVIWEGVIYTLITMFGPVLGTLVTMQLSLNFFSTLSAETLEALPSTVTGIQDSVLLLSGATLIPVGFISAIIGVGGLLLQLVLVHFLATMLFGGHGTIRHLLTTLLSFYNKWFPRLFLLSYISTGVFFVSAGSPITACVVIILVGMALYVLGNTSSKIGEAYDFGGARGCISLNLSNFIIIGLFSLVMFLLFQAVGGAALETFFRFNPTAIPPVQ